MSNLEPLTKLQVLYWKKLPNSNSIYWKALPFPDVCRIFVFKCPELKKLPLDLERAGQGKILIKGKEDWWKQLQSEDQVTQNALLPFLKSTNKWLKGASSTWMERFWSRSAGFSTTSGGFFFVTFFPFIFSLPVILSFLCLCFYCWCCCMLAALDKVS